MKKLICLLLLASTAQAENLYDSSRAAPEGTGYGTPSDMKMGLAFFEKLVKFAADSKTSALLLLKDNKLIVEKYWDQDPDKMIRLHSVTKSILSLGVGKLIDDGRLSLSDPAKNWFRDWKGEKESITIQQLLTQTSGYPEAGKEKIQGTNRLKTSVDQPNVAAPGSKFAYSNMGSWLLGEIIHQAAKKEADQYLADNFFKRVGIQNWTWDKDETQHPDTSGGLQLAARDLLKIGQLVLNRGKWGQEQLISEKFLEAATKAGGENSPNYGYLWWVDGENYYARGSFGQILAIYPKEKVILIRLQKTEPRQEAIEGNSALWENRAKSFGDQIRK